MAKGKFVAGYNRLDDGRNVWMIQANEGGARPGWNWDNLLDHEPDSDSWGGDNWISSGPSRKRINKEFAPGDIAFCYQGAPLKRLVGMVRISAPFDGVAEPAVIYMDWRVRVPPVLWDTFKTDKVLQYCEKSKIMVGTVFRVSETEAKRLLELMEPDAALRMDLRKQLGIPKRWLKGASTRERVQSDGDTGRVDTTVLRIIRDTELANRAKRESKYKCSMCGYIMVRGDGRGYAEAHHMRPLGKPHEGPDKMENLLVLCANCHAEFDMGAITVDPFTRKIFHVDNENWQHKTRPDREFTDGQLKYLKYHHEKIFRRF